MRALKNLLTVIGSSAIWPAYACLAAYVARNAPWPRSMALLVSFVFAVSAGAAFVVSLSRKLLCASERGEPLVPMPVPAARQLHRAILFLTFAAVAFLLPERLITLGLLTPGGRPLSAPSLCRLFELLFQIVILGVAIRLGYPRLPFAGWVLESTERFASWRRHRYVIAGILPVVIAIVIILDARGYTFTARRFSLGAFQFALVAALCWGLYKLILRAIDHQAWRWIPIGHSWTDQSAADPSGEPHDLTARLHRLAGYVVPFIGVLLCAWLWDFDLALLKSLGEQQLISPGNNTEGLTLGNVTLAALMFGLTVVVWRHLSTLFALVVFPRMSDDPGVRFAVLTLCRYAVLAAGVMLGLSAVHLGPAQIGMVLAALGVGLGFGLQEIVSNFVCGIILLLERPIRVGDIVTVGTNNGKVDRINIRATTIINGDNQAIIIPNRAFITGDLINWTLKDKIVRASVRVKAAPGTDPDRVAELLLTIAREDPDVLRNPLPGSLLEEFTDSALAFVLHVHVPDPSLSGRVRHRLMAQIQKRFRDAEIEIPLPAHELLVKPSSESARFEPDDDTDSVRRDQASSGAPAPHLNGLAPIAVVADCHRGVDE